MEGIDLLGGIKSCQLHLTYLLDSQVEIPSEVGNWMQGSSMNWKNEFGNCQLAFEDMRLGKSTNGEKGEG